MDIITYDTFDFFNKDDHFAKYRDVKSVLMHGTKNDKAEISIVMPVYKRVEYIREAIDSALNQNTKHSYNIIVVDNTEENDDIYNIVKTYPEDQIMYYKNEKNIGMFGNFNRCIELANAPWIAILHDDDKLKPGYIDCVLNIINNYSDCIAMGVEHDLINGESKVTEKGFTNDTVKKMSFANFYFQPAPVSIAGFVFKKDSAVDIGGFDEDYYPAADANFMCKLLSVKGDVYRIGKTLMQYRIADNESMNPQTLRKFVLYNYEQNRVLKDSVNSIFRLFYNIHQNTVMHEKMVGGLRFNDSVEYDDIKKFLNYKYSLSVRLYYFILRIIRPYLWLRIARKVKKIGGIYK